MEENQIYTLPIIGEIGKDFKYTDLLMHLNAAQNHSTIHGVIDSPGGDIEQGLKIRDALINSGKIIQMSNSGDVASIAVSIFLAATKGLRKFNPSRGVFLIHLPLIQPEDLPNQTYTAEDLDFISKSLKGYGSDLAKQYSQSTGANLDILKAFMQENTPLTPDQISGLGFAIIEQPEFKAVALVLTKKQQMDNKEVIERLDKFESLFDKLSKSLLGKFKAKAIMLQDVNGVEIDFGDAVQTEDQITVGVAATVGGKPADGEYPFADGKTFVFSAGLLTEIKESEQANEMEVELNALKAENAELKGKIEAVNKMQDEAKTALENANKEFKAFKAQYSKEVIAGDKPVDVKTKSEGISKDELRKQMGL